MTESNVVDMVWEEIEIGGCKVARLITGDDDEQLIVGELPNEITNASVVVYWYTYSSYEGEGIMFIKTPDGWRIHYCTHCSCYEALDNLEDSMRDSPVPTVRDLLPKNMDHVENDVLERALIEKAEQLEERHDKSM